MESPFRADVLKGKAALVTGGGSGIGFEIAAQLARHGAQVAIMGRRREVLDKAIAALRSQGLRAIGFDGDVRKQEDAARVLAATSEHFGKLDILVNGAAGNFLASPEDLTPKGFRTVLDIDTVGTYTMCYEALKYLKKGGPGKGPSTGGLIINISATLHYTATWYQIHVSAAKAGVDSITRSLALEWGTDYDIRVNGIAPGPIQGTPGLRKLVPEEMSKGHWEMMPLFKFGEKRDIAMAALYLASDAGKYVNGTTLVVDGGLWLSHPRHIPKEEVKELSKLVEKKHLCVLLSPNSIVYVALCILSFVCLIEIENIFDRYLKAPSTRFEEMDIQQKIIQEMTRMKDERNRLRIIMGHYMGEDLASFSVEDLSNLEQQMEFSLYKVRLRKQELLDQQLLEMHHREMHMSEEQSGYLCLMNPAARGQSQAAEMAANPRPFPWWDAGASGSGSGSQRPHGRDAEPSVTALQLHGYRLQPRQPNLQDASLHGWLW
ncbi:peroxisomal 2,4-dienoyl-CoA reductase-like [Panicum miliaceum]|uniref:2,4-dienoyl-CoA reductase [(3E)-enoyl-CoA-producing] n=1 Tax=Panicum miliaceum TaxID=4540 RepID=A0A3L6QBB7_PANMI|nr:peroxisomal 2,4-dienoyl-CoA reductase-like [Panicum miliaceum]